jgi:thiamine-phosphate pyrophosphorylase
LSGVSQLGRHARKLGPRRGGRKALPSLLFFTDPVRTPDPAAIAARLPRGAGVVFRAFGAPDAVETGRTLARICRRRGLMLLVGADPRLARRLHADGLHLPERLSSKARRHRGRFHVTVAAHSLPAALRAQRAGAEAVVVSPVFPSRSPSAGRPIGLRRLAALARRVRLPVYALGGVNTGNARRLTATGIVGIAAIEGLVRT